MWVTHINDNDDGKLVRISLKFRKIKLGIKKLKKN